jgi:hypothetical protein
MVRAMSLRRLAYALAAAALAAATAACAAAPVRVDDLSITYAGAPQPERVGQTLFLFVDPARVPDAVETQDPNSKPIRVHALRTFIRRDVSRVLADAFARIEVVDRAPVAASPHYVAEVSLVRLDTAPQIGAGALPGQWGGQSLGGQAAVAALDWSLVITDGLSGEVVYSFSDHAVGSFGSNDLDQTPRVIASALEAAVRNLAADLRKEQVGTLPSAIPARPATAARPAPMIELEAETAPEPAPSPGPARDEDRADEVSTTRPLPP